MSTTAPVSGRVGLPQVAAPAAPHDAGIDYQRFLDCVHCGLCTSACPTYVELGTEMDSPRGRIYLMRAVTDGRLELNATVRRHLDLCLDCRACESACPSGVQYGQLIEPFRVYLAKTGLARPLPLWQRLVLFHLFPYRQRVRLALAPARLLQRSRLDRVLERTLLRLAPAAVRQMHAMLPPLQPNTGRLAEVLPAEGKRRARVALFLGCVADALFPQTTLATARVLQQNGCEVWLPPGQGCCGALHYHAGQEAAARRFAAANCAAFGPGLTDTAGAVDAIIVNAAGCGAMLKDYAHLLHHTPQAEAARRFQARVRDVSEFLIELGPVQPSHPLSLKATYHDACHLCHAQQIRKQPRQLLEMIPGLELVPLTESEICCGAAGSYSLTEPQMAQRLGERKARHILATGASAVLTGNVGCLLQIGRHLRALDANLWLAHPVDLLWASYTGQENRGETGQSRHGRQRP